jgi:hypothetical protein
MVQRIFGGLTAGLTGATGVGTGYASGGVGKINNTWLGTNPGTGHMLVTANGTTMVLTIAPGWAVVVRDQGGSSYDPRAFLVESDANDSVTITSNATGFTRNDTVCLKVDQSTAPASDGANLVSFVVLAGASGGGLPNAPADGNLYVPLANVAVANGATSISQANVTDRRLWNPSDVNPFKARALGNANQALAASTFTKVSLQSIDLDPNGNFDNATNFRYWAPVPGYYVISGVVSFAGTLTAMTRYISMIYKTGVEIAGSRSSVVTSETTATQIIQVPTTGIIVKLSYLDYLELWAWSNTAQNLISTGLDVCSLNIQLLSAL